MLPMQHSCALKPWPAMLPGMQVARVDTEILAAVRAQSSSGGRARQDLGAAKATIEELFSKIRDIQRKAEQSELMVQEICRCAPSGWAGKGLTAACACRRAATVRHCQPAFRAASKSCCLQGYQEA